MNEKAFLMVSLGVICVTADPQILFNELFLRKYPQADVFCLPNMEEANLLAFQRYGIQCYASPQSGPNSPIALPTSGSYIVAISTNDTNEGFDNNFSLMPVPLSVDSSGTWSITALNGFGAGFCLSDMVECIMTEKLVYPIAHWHTDYSRAYQWAQFEYAHRFFSHYSGMTVSPRVPNGNQMAPGKMFINADFRSFEDDRQENPVLDRLLSNGLI